MNFAHQRQRDIPIGTALHPMAMNFQQQQFMAQQQMNFIEKQRLSQSMFIPIAMTSAMTNEAQNAFEEQDLEKDKRHNFEQPKNTLEELANVAGNYEKLS